MKGSGEGLNGEIEEDQKHVTEYDQVIEAEPDPFFWGCMEQIVGQAIAGIKLRVIDGSDLQVQER